jgi:hypothetical protein
LGVQVLGFEGAVLRYGGSRYGGLRQKRETLVGELKSAWVWDDGDEDAVRRILTMRMRISFLEKSCPKSLEMLSPILVCVLAESAQRKGEGEGRGRRR